MKQAWNKRREQFRRFNEWERFQSTGASDLRQIGEIIDLFNRLHPNDTDSQARLNSKITAFRRLRNALLRVPLNT